MGGRRTRTLWQPEGNEVNAVGKEGRASVNELAELCVREPNVPYARTECSQPSTYFRDSFNEV